MVYQHNNELPALASQLSIQFLGALPLMLLFASDSVTQILSVPTLFNNMCALMPGTTPPEPPERFYRNCTRSYFDLMSEDIPINLMYISRLLALGIRYERTLNGARIFIPIPVCSFCDAWSYANGEGVDVFDVC